MRIVPIRIAGVTLSLCVIIACITTISLDAGAGLLGSAAVVHALEICLLLAAGFGGLAVAWRAPDHWLDLYAGLFLAFVCILLILTVPMLLTAVSFYTIQF